MPDMNFDFLTNASADPFGYAGPQNTADEFVNTNSLGGGDLDFAGLLSDPDILRAMGDMGKMAGPGSFGDVVGTAASNLHRRRAVQRAGKEKMEENKSFQDKMIDALANRNLLSPGEDNGLPDSVTFDGDGGVSIKSKLAAQKPTHSGEELPLEAFPKKKETDNLGGSDLLDFSKRQSGSGMNLAGLDPQDVAMILNQENANQKMNLNTVGQKIGIDKFNATRQDKAKAAAAAIKAAAIKRKNALSDAATKRNFDLQLAKYKSDLQIERDPLKRQMIQSQINKLEAETGKTEEQITNEANKYQQEFDILGQKHLNRLEELDAMDEDKQAQIIAKGQADLKAVKNKVITPNEQLNMDKRTKDELASIAPEFINNKGKAIKVPWEERKANAQQANERVNNPIYYTTLEPEVQTRFGLDMLAGDTPGEVNPIHLPRHPKTGKQITSQQIIDTMKATGLTELQVLKRIGAI